MSLAANSGHGLGPDSTIVGIAFLQDEGALCVSATGGELLLVQASQEIQEVFSCGSLIVRRIWNLNLLCRADRQSSGRDSL